MDNPMDISKMYGISNCPNCVQSNTPTHLSTLNGFIPNSSSNGHQNMMNTTQSQGNIPNVSFGTVNSSPMADAGAGNSNTMTVMPNTTTQRAVNNNMSDGNQVISNAFNGTIPVTNESIQYLNGFIRSQIGRRVNVEFLVGTDTMVEKEGYLVAVGANFILLNELSSDDIIACDFYNLKFIKFYYNN